MANKNFDLMIFESQTKPTYTSFFNKINEISTDDDINVICNSDIFFDETIKLAENIKPNEMYALLRWEYQINKTAKLFERPDSQDTWIFRGKINNVYGDFTLGIRGCDNRIAHEFSKAGYSVLNPCRSIKSYHVHNSNIRNYTMKDVVPPPYLTIHPSSL